MNGIIRSWGRILAGYTPSLSIEITRECPLRCPGCYAYGDEHLGGDVTLREVSDFKGQELIDRFMAGEIDVDRQITHRLSLGQVKEGFELMRNGKSVRSVVMFE